jgi:hypothetical protein
MPAIVQRRTPLVEPPPRIAANCPGLQRPAKNLLLPIDGAIPVGMGNTRKKTVKQTVAPKRVERVEIASDAIAAKAYERFVARGGEHGHDVEDWLAAEADLRA